MVDKVVRMIKLVADNAWVNWAGRLVPNVVHCVQEAAKARDCEEKE